MIGIGDLKSTEISAISFMDNGFKNLSSKSWGFVK